MRNFRYLLAPFALVPLTSCGGAPYYTAAPIDAQVVDAETKEPIEGAIVVANWQLVVGSLDGQRERGQLEVKETVTDAAGKFHFNGFTKANPMMYELRTEDPRIVIFKPGYAHKMLSNQHPNSGVDAPGTHRTSDVNGETVKLKKMQALYGENSVTFYASLQIDAGNLIFEDCGWKKVPQLIIAMDQEKKRLKDLFPKAYVDLISIKSIEGRSKPWCGSVAEFFKEYKK